MNASPVTLSLARLDSWITRSRLAPFLAATYADHSAAASLYVWHARVSGACFEAIHHVEVLVRNAIHCQLQAGQPDDGLRSWLVDASILKPGELKAVDGPGAVGVRALD